MGTANSFCDTFDKRDKLDKASFVLESNTKLYILSSRDKITHTVSMYVCLCVKNTKSNHKVSHENAHKSLKNVPMIFSIRLHADTDLYGFGDFSKSIARNAPFIGNHPIIFPSHSPLMLQTIDCCEF